MNKLGFYIENTTVQFLRDALRKVKPPVLLIHAQDRGLLHEIRQTLSPDTFVIGRLFKEVGQQEAWLDSDDPARRGREFAEEILQYDFGLATETGAGGRLLIDAWMSLNEAVRGPASFPDFEVDDLFKRRIEAYDLFQVAFYERLQSEGVEAVAFNFAAGNFIQPDHYLDWLPGALETYTYLGFHEYGWPSLIPGPDVYTAALFYRTCMDGIRTVYGNHQKAIMTEAGLTMAYGDPSNKDHGWLNLVETLTEEDYWRSLNWYNNQMVRDRYVMGAALFQVGHNGSRWQTFRHLGENNDGNPILLMDRIEALNTLPPPPVEPPPPIPPVDGTLEERADALIFYLESSEDVVGELPSSVLSLDIQIVALTASAQQGAEVGALATNLQTRLGQVQALLTDYSHSGDYDPEDLQPLIDQADALTQELTPLVVEAEPVAEASAQVLVIADAFPSKALTAQTLEPVHVEIQSLLTQSYDLRAAISGEETEEIFLPESVRDVRAKMPQHPSKEYGTRSLSDIIQVVVHHTVTSPDTRPKTIAQVQIDKRDLPGISYHFLVNGDGRQSWVQSLQTMVAQAMDERINRNGIAVALAGNFTEQAPNDGQLEAAAEIIASLLLSFDLGIDAIVGRSELESVSSPGRQWLKGAQFKVTLLEKVREILEVQA